MKQVNLFECSEGVCKTCSHYSKLDNQHYCNFFRWILSPETLREKCEFKETTT